MEKSQGRKKRGAGRVEKSRRRVERINGRSGLAANSKQNISYMLIGRQVEEAGKMQNAQMRACVVVVV